MWPGQCSHCTDPTTLTPASSLDWVRKPHPIRGICWYWTATAQTSSPGAIGDCGCQSSRAVVLRRLCPVYGPAALGTRGTADTGRLRVNWCQGLRGNQSTCAFSRRERASGTRPVDTWSCGGREAAVPPPNVCSVVVCPHSAAERRQHAVRHGTCGLPLTQPVTQRCALVRSHYPQPSLCEAARPMRTPVQARCERFVLLPAGQPCEPIPSPQRPVLRRRVVVLPSAPVRVVATLRPNNGRVAKALRAARPVRICHLHCLVARVAVGKDQRGQQD